MPEAERQQRVDQHRAPRRHIRKAGGDAVYDRYRGHDVIDECRAQDCGFRLARRRAADPEENQRHENQLH